jgi:hypothetical protein
MLNQKKLFGVLVIMLGLATGYACSGKKSEDSNLMRAEIIKEGRLFVVPNQRFTGGHLDYKIYDNGIISYNGEVSYNATLNGYVNVELQPVISGAYRLRNRAAVMSSSYDARGKELREYLTRFRVAHVDAGRRESTVSVVADQKVRQEYWDYWTYTTRFRWVLANLNAIEGDVVLDLSDTIVKPISILLKSKSIEVAGVEVAPEGETVELSAIDPRKQP